MKEYIKQFVVLYISSLLAFYIAGIILSGFARLESAILEHREAKASPSSVIEETVGETVGETASETAKTD